MKHLLSKPFGNLAIAWKSNEFFRARIKLTWLYLAIVTVILALFSGLVIWQVTQSFTAQVAHVSLTAGEVEAYVATLYPDRDIIDIDLDLQGGVVVYHIDFAENKSIAIDPASGAVLEVSDDERTVIEAIQSEITEFILLIDLIILSISGWFAYLLAGRTLTPIRQQMEQQQRFIADAAHELRNPLTAVRASSESLLRTKSITPDETRTVLGEINEEADRLIQLTEQLLVLDRELIDVAEYSLPTVARSVVEKLQPLAAAKGIEIETVYEEVTVAMSQADIESIVFNLIHNAIKFSPAASTVTVTISTGGLLSVTDSGIGIAESDLPKLFDRFYKADDARAFTSESGSGLGLSIVKRIVDSHGGKIVVQSQVGQGTTITVQF